MLLTTFSRRAIEHIVAGHHGQAQQHLVLDDRHQLRMLSGIQIVGIGLLFTHVPQGIRIHEHEFAARVHVEIHRPKTTLTREVHGAAHIKYDRRLSVLAHMPHRAVLDLPARVIDQGCKPWQIRYSQHAVDLFRTPREHHSKNLALTAESRHKWRII